MESSTSRTESDKRTREALLKQMATLQSQLEKLPDPTPCAATPSSPKRKASESALLVPATPSPKKKRKLEHRTVLQTVNTSRQPTIPLRLSLPSVAPSRLSTSQNASASTSAAVSSPTAFLGRLASLDKPDDDGLQLRDIARTNAFTDAPSLPDDSAETTSKRDETLALIEDLEPGPVDHKPPFDDPHFEQLEPNSGIRLSTRLVPHEDFQDHLRGRFYLSPSRLYSCIRLLPDKQGYDVPVSGDWLTIAVVAERGPLKFSRAPIGVGDDEHGNAKPGKGKDKEPPPKPTGKKYVNLKLIDFGSRSRAASGPTTSVTGGKAVIRGDAFLTLLLFEADRFELVSGKDEYGEDTGKMVKVYKGGSGGAFEAMSKVKEGDVIALLNPKILKPFQRSADKPHPTSNILAITPSSASSILVLGRSKDLGMCNVLKRDGKPCGAWCDKRVSEVCEYHVQTAVERRRSGRAEFSIGTSGLSTTAAPKRKAAFDPKRQWGLLPSSTSSSTSTFSAPAATYVVSGHVVSSGVSESMGREAQARAQRKLQTHDSDRALKNLLKRDKEGMRAVVAAREVGFSHKSGKGRDEKSKSKKSSSQTKGNAEADSEEDQDSEAEEGTETKRARSKPAYSAEVIKQLGFDPIAKLAHNKDGCGDEVKRKLETLAALQSSRKVGDIDLRPPPGPKTLSRVRAPPQPTLALDRSQQQKSSRPQTHETNKLVSTREARLEEGMIDLDDI